MACQSPAASREVLWRSFLFGIVLWQTSHDFTKLLISPCNPGQWNILRILSMVFRMPAWPTRGMSCTNPFVGSHSFLGTTTWWTSFAVGLWYRPHNKHFFSHNVLVAPPLGWWTILSLFWLVLSVGSCASSVHYVWSDIDICEFQSRTRRSPSLLPNSYCLYYLRDGILMQFLVAWNHHWPLGLLVIASANSCVKFSWYQDDLGYFAQYYIEQ